MTPKLVVATGNAHKIEELKAILSETLPAEALQHIAPLSDFNAPDPVEDGVTFAENALIKARSACQHTGLPALADDSGISVEVLGGSPGVFSARWSGQHGADVANRDLLLRQLGDVPDEHRAAAFVCAIALVKPDGSEVVTEGRVDGTLLREARGEAGFGYDPIFVPRGHTLSTAQMDAAQKNSLSHRALALRQMTEALAELLS